MKTNKAAFESLVLAAICVGVAQPCILAQPNLSSIQTQFQQNSAANQSTHSETQALSQDIHDKSKNRENKSHPFKPDRNGCLSVAEAIKSPDLNPLDPNGQNKDLCISVHVFRVVELPDGTRFLDVCPSTASDEDCRFTVLNPKEDRAELGDLRKFEDQDIRIRGMVRSVHGRMGIVLSHIRQFTPEAEKFRPNARLLRNFDAQSDDLPVRDPNLKASGHRRNFMNTKDTEPTPTVKKP